MTDEGVSEVKHQRRAVFVITDDIRRAYEERDLRFDDDPDAPTLPPEFWLNGTIGRYYRPIKTQISVRIDNEELD